MNTFVTFYGFNVEHILHVDFRVMFKPEATSVDM